jgi:hypothetical protein
VEAPTIFNAFASAGVPIAAAAAHWLTQSFWGVLSCVEVRCAVGLMLTEGADYAVYLCVALLEHLRESIVAHANQLRLGTWLLAASARGFTVEGHLTPMRRLQRRHRAAVLPTLEADAPL